LPRQLWCFFTSGSPLGLCHCREAARSLVWDDQNRVYLLDRAGGCQAEFQCSAPIASAAAADDGSAFVVSSKTGRLWWLRPDLTPCWERTLDHSALAMAIDAFGGYLAVADRTANLHVTDRNQQTVWQTQSVKALLHLAFVPEAPLLVGAAEFGLVTCFDFSGATIWRDAPVAHVGALSLSAGGQRICLASYSDGVRMYRLDGKPLERLPQPCALVSISADGSRILVADTVSSLHLLDASGKALLTDHLEKPLTALAINALGHATIVALPDRSILSLALDEGP
jgi:hypothetical protein